MPVLPAVPSTINPPGRNAPRASASRTMASAARSFTEPPGFMNSALPRIVQPVSSEALRNLMRGVSPMAASTSCLTIMTSLWCERPAKYVRLAVRTSADADAT